ncbi:MAG: valine--tRNA ligase [Clostridiales Family XIII bacterium]|jgi:valyl-tRNA synthetase|nr:valine--tRNA ligase [Clostridiales Family XIII bacterium]
MEQNANLAKNYDPKAFEERIYAAWEKSGAFHAAIDRAKKPFTIVIPPPNITGQLHMGHALDQTLQDVLTRWRRMQGYCALWLPGTDHASIATEVKVAEEILATEGKSKHALGREEFLKRAWEWKRVYGGKITGQMRKLGNSCDWARERFTMDEGCNRAVRAYFVRLYEKGLIYRGNRLINWCPRCGTSLSDAEVEHEDKSGTHWYFRYPGADGGPGIVVATSRPETMFADVAIAVHPDDARYGALVGTQVCIPLTDRRIPILADPYPDPEKGTGAVKITPAHDPNDFEVGERHGLDMPSCIDENAVMTGLAEKYAGMDRFACRKAWVQALAEAGFLVKTEEKIIPIGKCYRCDTVIEPLLSDQWFVRMDALAQPAIAAAKEGRLTHVPEHFEKIYLHWLAELRDWCVSRQLWWGHRIPAWYCDACGGIAVAAEAPRTCPECGSDELRQDEDVLDTWFSSALWPFSTLGWPEKTEDLSYFYPTSVLVTGYDIIFFWVVRMVFSGLEVMGELPFRHVYVHGLVRDGEGRKMSKSLGNGVDPLEIIERYGADALRFALISGVSAGSDMRFQTEKIESARNFANKLWNASRFVIMNLPAADGVLTPVPGVPQGDARASLPDEDQWMLRKTAEAAAEITRNMERFELSAAAQKIYELIWSEYCDWYIELVKERLYGYDEAEKARARSVLVKVLRDILKLLHPFMPFITEEIWGFLPPEAGAEAAAAPPSVRDGDAARPLLISAAWPEATPPPEDLLPAAARIEQAKELIRSIRNIRAEAGAAPAKLLPAVIVAAPENLEALRREERHLKKTAGLAAIAYATDKAGVPPESASAVTSVAEVFIPLDELIDYKAEFERLNKEKTRVADDIARIGAKLANPGFTGKAPARLVSAERERLAVCEETAAKLAARLAFVEKKLS